MEDKKKYTLLWIFTLLLLGVLFTPFKPAFGLEIVVDNDGIPEGPNGRYYKYLVESIEDLLPEQMKREMDWKVTVYRGQAQKPGEQDDLVRIRFKEPTFANCKSRSMRSENLTEISRSGFFNFSKKYNQVYVSPYLLDAYATDPNSPTCRHGIVTGLLKAQLINAFAKIYDNIGRTKEENAQLASLMSGSKNDPKCRSFGDYRDGVCRYLKDKSGLVSENYRFQGLANFDGQTSKHRRQLLVFEDPFNTPLDRSDDVPRVRDVDLFDKANTFIDGREYQSAEEAFAVNMEYMLTNFDYPTARPDMAVFFSRMFGIELRVRPDFSLLPPFNFTYYGLTSDGNTTPLHRAFESIGWLSLPGQRIFTNADFEALSRANFREEDRQGFKLDPSRVYQVHAVKASECHGEYYEFGCRFGHFHLLFVVCGPDTPFGPDCLNDVEHFVTFDYHTREESLERLLAIPRKDRPKGFKDFNFDRTVNGIFGGVPTKAIIYHLPERMVHYAYKQDRRMETYSINLSDADKELLIYKMNSDFHNFIGSWKHLSDNCVGFTGELLKGTLLDHNLAGLNWGVFPTPFPTDMIANLQERGVISTTPSFVFNRCNSHRYLEAFGLTKHPKCP